MRQRTLLLSALLLASPLMAADLSAQLADSASEYSKTVTAAWDKPTQRLNGAVLPDSELSHYEVKFTFNGVEIDYRIDHPSTTVSHVITAQGTHCATVRAVDTDGLASPWADQVCTDIASPPQKLIIRFVVMGADG